MRTKKGETRKFCTITNSILNGPNRMLTKLEEESPARGLHVDFSTKGKGDKFNGLLKGCWKQKIFAAWT